MESYKVFFFVAQLHPQFRFKIGTGTNFHQFFFGRIWGFMSMQQEGSCRLWYLAQKNKDVVGWTTMGYEYVGGPNRYLVKDICNVNLHQDRYVKHIFIAQFW